MHSDVFCSQSPSVHSLRLLNVRPVSGSLDRKAVQLHPLLLHTFNLSQTFDRTASAWTESAFRPGLAAAMACGRHEGVSLFKPEAMELPHQALSLLHLVKDSARKGGCGFISA